MAFLYPPRLSAVILPASQLRSPSGTQGHFWLPVALAGIAAGADGVMIEVHTDPQHALSDGSQALKPERLPGLIEKLRGISGVLGRRASFG